MKPGQWGVFRWLGLLGWVLSAGLCLAAYVGMGGWSQALPTAAVDEPPSQAQDMARPLTSAPIDTRLIAQHSLFSQQRGPDRQSFATPSAGADSAMSQDWVLASMMITPSMTVAVFLSPDQRAARVRLGEGLPGGVWTFARAEPRAAILIGASGERRLALRTYTGQAVGSPALSAFPPPSTIDPTPAPAPMTGTQTSEMPVSSTSATPELSPEEAMRQRLAKRRAEIQLQNPQGQNPL